MSKIIEAKFVCEKCRKEFAGQSYLSINAQINPELKEKVMDGSVFEIVCPNCGHRMIDIHPLVYNDMEKQAMIRVDTFGGLILAEREHKRFAADFPEIGNSYAFYGATTVTDFINKVVFVENGIDPIEGQIIMHFFLDVATSKLNEKIKKSPSSVKLHLLTFLTVSVTVRLEHEKPEKSCLPIMVLQKNLISSTDSFPE